MNLIARARKALEFDLHEDVAIDDYDDYSKLTGTKYYISEARTAKLVEALLEIAELGIAFGHGIDAQEKLEAALEEMEKK